MGWYASKRLARELQTVTLMIECFCRDKHGGDALCPKCADLLSLAATRLKRCPHQAVKPVCSECRIHCYRASPEIHARIKEIMRHSGPRMLRSHPVLAVLHLMHRIVRGAA